MFFFFNLLKFYYSTKEDEESKDNTTLQFDLKVKCIRNKNAPKNATDPDELFINSKGMLHAVVGGMHPIRSVNLGCTFLGKYVSLLLLTMDFSNCFSRGTRCPK